MSFILDALRKVDRESRQADEVVPPVAAVEKLRREKQHRRRQFGAMAAIGVVSAAATTLLIRRPPLPETPPPAQQTTAIEAPVETPPLDDVDVDVDVEAEVALDEPPPVVPVETAERSAQTVQSVQSDQAVLAVPAEVPTEDPGPESAPELPQLVLQGTSVLSGKPVAVVSDRRVFEGDTIEGAVVVRIEERLVELEFEGRRFTLTF
jgi:hypothetical protein